MDQKLIEKVKKEIISLDSLSGSEKIDLLTLLDTASIDQEIRENCVIMESLENLYNEVDSQDYKDALLLVLKKYRREVRQLSYQAQYLQEPPLLLGDLLEVLGISTEGMDSDLLCSKVVVAQDDGMGYAASGFKDALSGYRDSETGEIRIWT